MDDLNRTLEEENLEKVIKELSETNPAKIPPKEELGDREDMDTHGDVLLKYECDICKKRVMTKKGLKSHKSIMHKKSLQRIEREKKTILL